MGGGENGPRGELSLRTMAMPGDANPNGDIFGGWVLAQMDLAAGMAARQRSHGRVALVAVDSMEFHRPVSVGDVVNCHTEIMRIGRTSMTIHVETWVDRQFIPERIRVTEGVFTLVAIDEKGRPRPVPPR